MMIVGGVGVVALLGVMMVLQQTADDAAVVQDAIVATESPAPLSVPEEYEVDEADYVAGEALVAAVAPVKELSAAEYADLQFLREEEKLAHDVYLALYERWQKPIFQNIAGSEATHMTAVLTLLERYDISDTAMTERGVFTNATLQTLYTDLVAQGSRSLADALRVGAYVEDLDIYDLSQMMTRTDAPDLLIVYENLQRGSRNHLRAFYRQLQAAGVTYVPEHITPEELVEIVASATERGTRGGRWQ